MVARLPLIAEGVEDKAVGAQLILGDAVVAFVVFVALSVVFEGSVLGGTHKLAYKARVNAVCYEAVKKVKYRRRRKRCRSKGRL